MLLMSIDITMPKLGLTMEEGTVVRWLVTEGEHVTQGTPLLEVETDKVVVEVEAPASGVMGSFHVHEGEKALVGALLARLHTAEERQEKEGRSKTFSTPRARWRAHMLGVDWRKLAGTGPQARVIERDVLAAAKRLGAESPESAMIAAASERRVEKEAVSALPSSSFPLPFSPTADRAQQFHLGIEVVAEALLEMYSRLSPAIEKRAGIPLTVTDLLIRICGAALAQIPQANACWEDGRVRLQMQVCVGVATVAGQGELRAPLLDADRKPLSQIASERANLVERARREMPTIFNLQSSILNPQSSIFTLVDLGAVRVDTFQAVLNPPESAILTVGRIAQRPAVVDGRLTVRRTAMLTLSCDRRVFTAALAAQFLDRVADLIEEPYGLLT